MGDNWIVDEQKLVSKGEESCIHVSLRHNLPSGGYDFLRITCSVKEAERFPLGKEFTLDLTEVL